MSELKLKPHHKYFSLGVDCGLYDINTMILSVETDVKSDCDVKGIVTVLLSVYLFV